jgi:uncharacterized damage-inducible protein DinB
MLEQERRQPMANRYMESRWSWIAGSNGLRDAVLSSLSDADLAYSPGGSNMAMGALFREMGETEHSYLQSLKTFSQDWSYHNTEAGLAESTAKLQAWFHTLDDEMKSIIAAFTDDDLAKTVQRGESAMPVEMQLEVYLQALFIFFGKVTVYLRAMEHDFPPSWQEYIG